MYVKLFEDNPNGRDIRKVVDILKDGGVIIYPTDTIYAMGCDINQVKAVQRVCHLKGVKPEKANFSIICQDLSNIAMYAKVSNEVFKLMKHNLPGPFTFILPATNRLPNVMMNRRKTIGIRVPDNFIVQAIVEELGNPLLTTSVKADDEVVEYMTDPELIHERYGNLVDLVIDGGYGKNVASTVVDCTGDEITIVRQGIGDLI
ncbi:MAG TPA: threonylcarbamoyl-AMP synthase [Candidatus Odoribacter faecigallinarum]|jgi:tRNA threonylcarbamoyl adenosine modification protein (Sua5/YciO/YrdC/YwlC family)|uniref:Threonylcarbamoyl-AMP synthase n=1 Tax=Candidatus Odoribacter faecigallinarum TaxID=2838706 RepID=A0A9D1UY54_9BACT|nr:threonylcarbamoyl-AMP synthase [Candidatus Odoribacter faecigallinarum]